MSEIGIDLGTANVLVYMKGKGVVISEPSIVAVDDKSGEIVAIGEEAKKMLGRTNQTIRTIRPLREGVISDFVMTEAMLRYFIKKAMSAKRSFLPSRPKIAVCIPGKITGVERRAVEEATKQAGAKEVFIISEPLAAAIGCGLNIEKPEGRMIIDIGGGTTDVAVISLGGVVVTETLRLAGDNFDESIINYIRKKYQLHIGERSAEMLKINIGTVTKNHNNETMGIKGRDLVSGLPRNVVITQDDMYEAMVEVGTQMAEVTKRVFENTHPELASDIYQNGIVMTGGGALTHGLNEIIEAATGVHVVVPEYPLFAVAIGTGRFVEHISKNGYAKNFKA